MIGPSIRHGVLISRIQDWPPYEKAYSRALDSSVTQVPIHQPQMMSQQDKEAYILDTYFHLSPGNISSGLQIS
jgi:hypothetical protein